MARSGPTVAPRYLSALLGLVLMLALAPPARSQVLPPDVPTNPIGTMRWLPDDANQQRSLFAWMSRLVVVYDHSLDVQGNPVPLEADGTFTFSLWTPTGPPETVAQGPTPPLLQVHGWSPAVTLVADVPNIRSDPFVVSGNIRDGDCSKLETGGFSEAYSTTRTFVHDGSTPYKPQQGEGHCEIVDTSVEIRDEDGAVVGFDTTVTDHVPGFWISTRWPSQGIPDGGGRDGRVAATTWYSAMYGSEMGDSETLGSPGAYDEMFTFEAERGECQSRSVVIGPESKRIDFEIYPTGNWDLTVSGPDGETRTASAPTGFEERIITPGYLGVDLPSFTAGEHTMTACNIDGEAKVLGTVTTEDGTELRSSPCGPETPALLELHHLPANPWVYLDFRVPAQINREQVSVYLSGRAASGEIRRADAYRIDSGEWKFFQPVATGGNPPGDPYVGMFGETIELDPDYTEIGGNFGFGLPSIKETPKDVSWFASMWQRYAAGHGRLTLCAPPGTEVQSWRVGQLITATASDMDGSSLGYEGGGLTGDAVVSPDGLSFAVDVEHRMFSVAFPPTWIGDSEPDFTYSGPDGSTTAIPQGQVLADAPPGRHMWSVGAVFGGSPVLMVADVPPPEKFEGPEETSLLLTVDGKGSNRVLTATLTELDTGAPIVGQDILFYADDASIGTAHTDGSGIATFTAPPRYRGGSFTFRAVFEGDFAYLGSWATAAT